MESDFKRDKITIGIVGGTGLMGQWFRRFFEGAGHGVLFCGRKTELSEAELVRRSEVVILSLPLAAAMDAAKRLGPLLTEGQALMDFCSLKAGICRAMLESTVAEVCGAHPLFGPTTAGLSRQNVILCPMRGARWKDWLSAELAAGGALVTETDPAVHDRHMAVVQGLTHFATITLGRTLADLGLAPESLLPYATPIFRAKLALVGRLFAQDLSLYAGLVGKNPETEAVLAAFEKAAAAAREALVGNGDPGAGLSFLGAVRDFLGDFPARGFAESDAFLAVLSDEARKNQKNGKP